MLLYQDSFEICNPLGSSKKKHKLLAVYAMIGNLPPQYRSSLDNIILVMLIKESHIKVFGQKIVFQQLLNDLIKLETEGIELQGRRVKCQLFSVLGDNLGSHMIGGFSESFSCEFFCRYCLMTKDKFKTEPYESGVLRNVSHYETVVKRLQLQNANMMHGIKINSVFNQLQSFHVCRPGLPPCIGHDLFEGVVAYDLPLFVKHFVDQHWFTYDILNAQIRRFLYMGYDAASKPPAFSVNGKRLAGQAVENWCLLKTISNNCV